MKLKFKQQAFQTEAVKAVADCFAGQPKGAGFRYAIDRGRVGPGEQLALADDGFANARLALAPAQILENIQAVQRRQNLTVSSELKSTPVCAVNLDVEHFLEQYGKRVRWFVYNSKQLHNLESFSSDAGINVMIVNVQAFAARGEDARRI